MAWLLALVPGCTADTLIREGGGAAGDETGAATSTGTASTGGAGGTSASATTASSSTQGGVGATTPFVCDEDTELSPDEYFDSIVRPGLVEHCGACHMIGDVQDSPEPCTLFLYEYPNSGDHFGPGYPDDTALEEQVLCWLGLLCAQDGDRE